MRSTGALRSESAFSAARAAISLATPQSSQLVSATSRCPVFLIDREFSYRSQAPAHRLDYHGLGLALEDLELGLAGPFQHENAAIDVSVRRASGSRAPITTGTPGLIIPPFSPAIAVMV